jgi:hypothetical protein
MVTLDAKSLEDLALVIGTAFPVLAVAYYSAARSMLDDKLEEEGPEWNVNMDIPTWTRNRVGHFLIQAGGNTRFREGQPDKFPFNERFRLATDRNFMLTMPLGFALTLAYLIFSWRWTLALSIVLLQGTIGTLIIFGTQVSMIRLASAIAKLTPNGSDLQPSPNESDLQPAEAFWRRDGKSLRTRPMGGLIRAVVVSVVLLGLAICAAIIVQLATVKSS